MYIWLDAGTPPVGAVDGAVVERMASEIEFLRGELQRKDTIIMSLVSRVPELEPASEVRESPVTVSEAAGKGDAQDARPWYRRVFGV